MAQFKKTLIFRAGNHEDNGLEAILNEFPGAELSRDDTGNRITVTFEADNEMDALIKLTSSAARNDTEVLVIADE